MQNSTIRNPKDNARSKAEMSRGPQALRSVNEPPWRHHNIGRLILLAFRYFERNLLLRLQAVGFSDVRTAHLGVLRQLDMGGTRIIDIAERAGTTKQAMGQVVADCEKQKLVATQIDPTDRRAKIVTFTGRGRALIEAAHNIVDDIEQELIVLVGDKQYDVMKSALARIAAQPMPDSGIPADPRTRSPDKARRPVPRAGNRKRPSGSKSSG
jgi:DNA-binding MarR family transcriptional regulator